MLAAYVLSGVSVFFCLFFFNFEEGGGGSSIFGLSIYFLIFSSFWVTA